MNVSGADLLGKEREEWVSLQLNLRYSFYDSI